MKNFYIAFGLLTLISLQGCAVTKTNGEPVTSTQTSSSESTTGDAVKKEAIEVALRDTVMPGGNQSRQAPIICSLPSGRQLVYEDGTEYVKSRDEILATRHIPLGPRGSREWLDTKIDKMAAIKLTEADAISVYSSIEKFKISACELPAVWRIIYELSSDKSGGGPDYVVDKRSGQIIYKKYSQ